MRLPIGLGATRYLFAKVEKTIQMDQQKASSLALRRVFAKVPFVSITDINKHTWWHCPGQEHGETTKKRLNKKTPTGEKKFTCERIVCDGKIGLVGELSLDVLAVQASDVGDRLVLRALSLTSASVGAVTEAQLLHLGNHVLGATCSLGTTLGQQSKLADLA